MQRSFTGVLGGSHDRLVRGCGARGRTWSLRLWASGAAVHYPAL